MNHSTATLILEDGTIYTGQAFGAQADVVFELVFNTSMTGYQEILTDPSYRGQGVLFTAVHIGNVGINVEDSESEKPQVSAIIIHSLSPVVSNWRATTNLSTWLLSYGVPGISGIDTRALTHKLREGGTLKAALSTQGTDTGTLLQMVQNWSGLDGRDMVCDVTCAEIHDWKGDAGSHWVKDVSQFVNSKKNLRVLLYDFGAKNNILRHLAALGVSVIVVPAGTSTKDVLDLDPDGIMLSNGPGDPTGLPYAIKSTSGLIESNVPIFGICLGHQLIGLALGGKISRLKFGHHGGNHPVQDLRSKKVYITAQNHNYMILAETLDKNMVEVTHISLNDGSIEGLQMKNKPVYSVQFHPEAAPGPHDSHELFMPFIYDICARKNLQIARIKQPYNLEEKL